MSGEKRIMISSSEHNRLRLAEARLREIQANLPEVVNELRNESAAELRRQLEPLNRRQLAFAQEMETVHADLAALAADQRQKADLAQAWIEAAEALSGFIAAHYPHQQFAPGQLDALTQAVQQARESLLQGTAEVAISTAQHTHQRLTELRQTLETDERAWCEQRQAALATARATLSVVDKNRECHAVDLQGQKIDVAVNVDQWAEGKVSTLAKELTDLIAKIENDQTPLTTAELCAIEQQTLPALQQQLEHAVHEARLQILGAQLRINIADLVVQALEEKGFTVQDGTYEGEDERKGYAAKVTHLDGSEVVVLVSPVAGDPGKNEMRIHSYDADQLTDHELRQRTLEINQALRARGLEVSEPQEAAAQADPALRDLARLRQRHAQAQPTSVSA